jgi:type II secretory ATPase GspE/PulE/Tfp pilus assembly ATPase PilB-like protein
MATTKHHDLPPIQLTAAGRDEKEQKANLKRVTPSPGYPTCVHLICDAIEKRSDTTVFDFTPQIVNIRYRIDGVWHSMPQMDRETGDFMMATLKQLAGMNFRERRARQQGKFGAMLMKKKYKCRVLSQGVQSGERIALYINIPEPPIDTLEQMGINAAIKTKLMQSLNKSKGLNLVAAMPGEGFTATWRATLSACDRLMRDFYVMEEKNAVEEEVINIQSKTFDESKGETAFTHMPNLLLQEPNVLAFTDPKSGEILNQILDLSEKNYMVMTRIHGKHCVDALLRLMAHKPNIKMLAEQLQSIVCMRVVRKLCEECRIPYAPHPKLLAQLGIPQGRVRQFYRAFEYEPGMVDDQQREIEPCEECSGIGYKNRTGIFEVVTVDDQFRQTMIKAPRLDHLSAAAKAGGNISMRDMGVLAVASGVTSLEELQRVLSK